MASPTIPVSTGVAGGLGRVVERVFGPDPGRVRLRMAARAVTSCSLALVVSLGLQALGWTTTAGLALGFMVAIFGSMMVGPGPVETQAVDFLLLALPPLPSMAAAAFLSPWQWARDLGFVAVAMGAILARQGGQRGAGMGMTGYIAYLLGAIFHPAPAALPLILVGAPVGAACAALVRLLVLPDRPRQALVQAGWDALRRVPAVLRALQSDLDGEHEGREGRLHRQVAWLSDAVLMAEQQREALPDGAQEGLRPFSSALFGLELAAERAVRAVGLPPPEGKERERVRQAVAALRAELTFEGGGEAPRLEGPIAGALEGLRAAAVGLRRELDGVGS